MDNETNRNIVKRYYNALNNGGIILFEEFFSPDFIDHNGYPDQTRGPEGVRQGYIIWIDAFPDNHTEITEIIAENDRVAVRTIATGTHTGEFMGIAPTGNKIRVEGISIYRLHDGRICERWGLTSTETL